MAPTKKTSSLTAAYAYCQTIASTHYENFPIASFVLPQPLRLAIAAIYAWARMADDLADTPNLTAAAKLQALAQLEEQLIHLQNHPQQSIPLTIISDAKQQMILQALTDSIQQYDLPIALFFALLQAFKQDVTKYSYANFAEILEYCNNSANPIGRLLLHLNKQATIENIKYADCICTSLQLINFMQDLTVDLTMLGRCYLPTDELTQYQVSIADLTKQLATANVAALIKHQLDRIDKIYQAGLALGNNLTGLFGWEIKLIIAAGQQILNSLYCRENYYARPTLTFINKIQMLWQTLFYQTFFIKPFVTSDQ